MLGIDTTSRSETELTIFGSIIPRMEAYHEYLNRPLQTKLSPQRAYNLIYAITEDEDAANAAYNKLLFEETPLE